jgi:hypothetical protein
MSIQFNFYGGNRDFYTRGVPTHASTQHLLLRVNSGCGDQQTPSGNSAFYQFNVCPVHGSCSIRYSAGKNSNILLSQYVRYDTSGVRYHWHWHCSNSLLFSPLDYLTIVADTIRCITWAHDTTVPDHGH